MEPIEEEWTAEEVLARVGVTRQNIQVLLKSSRGEKLDRSKPYGIHFNGPDRYNGADGKLFDMQTDEIIGEVLDERAVKRLTAGIDDILDSLEETGCRQEGDDLNKAYEDCRKGLTVIYSDRQNPLNMLARTLRDLESKLKGAKPPDAAARDIPAEKVPPATPEAAATKHGTVQIATRQEITIEMHRRENLRFFRNTWSTFCDKVEDYARKLYALERQTRETYDKEWDDKDLQKWREAQAAPWKKKLEQAEQADKRARQTFTKAMEQWDKAIQQIYSAWATLPTRDVLARLKSLALADADRKQLMRRAEKVENAREDCRAMDFKIHELRPLADFNHYSPQNQAKAQSKPGHVWTNLFEERYLTAYLQVAPEDRRQSKMPEPWIGLTAFWRPTGWNNPAAWFGLVPAPAMDLDDDDQSLHDAVILCVAHHQAHKDDPGAKRIVPPGEYQGTHFLMWGFVADLEKTLTGAKIIEAWNGVQSHLHQSPPAISVSGFEGVMDNLQLQQHEQREMALSVRSFLRQPGGSDLFAEQMKQFGEWQAEWEKERDATGIHESKAYKAVASAESKAHDKYENALSAVNRLAERIDNINGSIDKCKKQADRERLARERRDTTEALKAAKKTFKAVLNRYRKAKKKRLAAQENMGPCDPEPWAFLLSAGLPPDHALCIHCTRLAILHDKTLAHDAMISHIPSTRELHARSLMAGAYPVEPTAMPIIGDTLDPERVGMAWAEVCDNWPAWAPFMRDALEAVAVHLKAKVPGGDVLQGAPSGTLPADIHAKICKTIRSRVDDLLIEHPWLWADFARHAEHFKACFVAWADFPATKRGMERASRPPCPSTWEIDDKTCCQYVTLGIIRDMAGGAQIDKPLVAHILSDALPRRDAYTFTAYLIAGPRHPAYTKENLEGALQYVEQDIAERAPKTTPPRADGTGAGGDGEERTVTSGPPSTEIWSNAVSKSRIVTALHLRNTDDLNKHVKAGIYTIRKVKGNRQRWQIRLDTLTDTLRKRLKDIAPIS